MKLSDNGQYLLQPEGDVITLSEQELLAILSTSSWFNELPDYLIAKIVELSSIRNYEDGDVIHYQGDTSRGLYAVLSGAVKVSSLGADGKECVFRYLAPGSWFGEIGMLDKSARTHDARVINNTLLLVLSSRDVQTLLNLYPIFYKFLALLLCRVVRNAFTMLNDTTLLSVSARLAKRLISLAEAYGEPHERGILIGLYLTQDDMATIINTTRQTINKRLVDWQKLGWIDAKYGKILIMNSEALKQLYMDE
ncbi:Crp/Fnr family transcriptional regulator [Pantoea coffeiphila]|uniref:Crp/Fnr family transcriptional regulator n=1 Tax=Erwiniaceae TaxID=1903409 RepID=UPI003083F687|nr:CRP-like cAMP-binding protein [Pantoea coffeiphila]